MITAPKKQRKHWAVDVFTGVITEHAFPAFSMRLRASNVAPPSYHYVADGVVALHSSSYYNMQQVVGIVDVHSGDVLARYSAAWSDSAIFVTPYKSVVFSQWLQKMWIVTVTRVDLYCSVRWMWIAAIVTGIM
jgi:hypothetical protein